MMKSNLKSLLIWLLVAYGLCLIPGQFYNWLVSWLPIGGNGSSGSISSDWIEWAAHAILLAGVAFHLVLALRQVAAKPPNDRLMTDELMGEPLSDGPKTSYLKLKTTQMLATITIVACIAVSIEWLQGLLPESFHRGPSASDIWASLFGGLMGAGAALRFKRAPVEPI